MGVSPNIHEKKRLFRMCRVPGIHISLKAEATIRRSKLPKSCTFANTPPISVGEGDGPGDTIFRYGFIYASYKRFPIESWDNPWHTYRFGGVIRAPVHGGDISK